MIELFPHVSTNYVSHKFFEYVIDPLYIRFLSRNASRRHGLFAPIALIKMAMDRLLEGLDVSKTAKETIPPLETSLPKPNRFSLGIGRI